MSANAIGIDANAIGIDANAIDANAIDANAIDANAIDANAIGTAIKKSTSRRSSTPKKVSSVKKTSAQRYLAITEHINKHILKTACMDSRICLAFGTFSQQIRSYFAGFTDFQFAVGVKQLGKPSANGFVNEIEYAREGFADENETSTDDLNTYKSYAILKSSQKASADNLMYEYRVGQYINTLNRLYPCFLETYGLFKYNTHEDWQKMAPPDAEADAMVLAGIIDKKERKNAKRKMQERNEKLAAERKKPTQAEAEAEARLRVAYLQGLTLQPIDYALACQESLHLAILIQHFNNFTSVDDMMRDKTLINGTIMRKNTNFIYSELMYVLFQVYIPLAHLKDTFTHYDMHLNNLYLYEPAEGQYIEYHYYLVPDAKPVSFKSKYMTKMIDYGRSYFKDGAEDSQTIIDDICKIPECNTGVTSGCGYNVGFQFLMTVPEADKKEAGDYLNTHKKNENYDLWPLAILRNHYYTSLSPELQTITRKAMYEGKEQKPEDKSKLMYKQLLSVPPPPKGSLLKRFFTKKVKGSTDRSTKSTSTGSRTLKNKSTKRKNNLPMLIYNVHDAANYLLSYVTQEDFIEANTRDHIWEKKLGDMHVYFDGRPMVFDRSEV